MLLHNVTYGYIYFEVWQFPSEEDDYIVGVAPWWFFFFFFCSINLQLLLSYSEACNFLILEVNKLFCWNKYFVFDRY